LQQVFVGGCPRSGTTFLGNLLGTAPEYICLPETDFIAENAGRWSGANYAPDRLEPHVRNHRRYLISGGQLTEADWVDVRQATSYEEFFNRFCQHYARHMGKPQAIGWVDQTPSNLRYAVHLARSFPNAHFIHIIRDGRAIANSLLGVDWGPSTPVAAGDYWARLIAPGLAAQLMLGPERMITIHYEDLVRENGKQLRKLAKFLSSPGLVRDREDQGLVLPDHYSTPQPDFGGPPDKSRVDAWRKKLSAREIEIFEATAGGLLENLGYPRNFVHPKRPLRSERLKMELREHWSFWVKRLKFRKRWRQSLRQHPVNAARSL
jgi:hypothetical protein